jgi:hypothetical protein
VVGDLVTNAERFPFVVEVKRHEKCTLNTIINDRPSPIWQWWRQAQRDAERVGKEPMLWFRKNNMRFWVVVVRRDYCLKTSILDGVEAHAWTDELAAKVSCGAIPRAFLSTDLLELNAASFAL